MKKIIVFITIFIALFLLYLSFIPNKVSAENITNDINNSRLLQIKESNAKTLEEYQKKYNSEAYGLTAYILHLVQLYSIPFCFLGIVVSFTYKTIIGRRHMENAEKGLGMGLAFITITIVCQVLPLVFALVIKLSN